MGELSVTLKQQGKDAPWIVVRGENAGDIRKTLIETFEIPDDPALTLADLVNNAQAQFTQVGRVRTVLGGQVVGDSGGSQGSAWDDVAAAQRGGQEAAPAAPERNPLLDALDACTTQQAVKELWAKNRPEFEGSDELTAAMKKRYEEVK